MNSYILRVDCPDEKGLIYKITGLLFEHGLNVENQSEFVDESARHFFMRTEVTGELQAEQIQKKLKATLPGGANIELHERRKKKIVVLVTKEPHCIGDLLLRHDSRELQAEIVAVVGNHETLKPLCQKFEIPFFLVSHEDCEREEHEERLLKTIASYHPEYLVLAKYMQVLSDNFVSFFPNQIINIHHSFLPAFVGAKPYHRAYERGVKIIGATAHFVTHELDEGPIISQDTVPVTHATTVPQMIRAGRNVERTVLANALQLVFEDRVFVKGNRTVVFE